MLSLYFWAKPEENLISLWLYSCVRIKIINENDLLLSSR
jgi:hypothetical protein